MPKIEWSSLIADPDGRIDYDRLFSFFSVFGFAFGILVVALAMAGIIPKNEYLTWGAGILVAPMTAKGVFHGARGVVSAARGVAQRRATTAVIRGEAAGRRASDPDNRASEIPPAEVP